MGKPEMLKENRDELTGLLDKHAFYAWGQELIDTKEDEAEYAFIFFDLSNFKLFNANYGYEKGDELLVSIAQILKEVFKNQLVARFSGDHFAVCANAMQVVPSITEARSKVKEIQKSVNLELKAGVYIYEGDVTDVIRCTDRARMACVSIKKKYDIDYKFYDEELGGTLIRKQFIIDTLDEALANDYITVYYQPIVRSLTGEVCGWEALVRWIDPERGMVYPNEFISVLEEYRLIHKLDGFVMEKVIKTFTEIRKANRREAVPVSINLSRIDFEALDIVTFVDGLIDKYQADKDMFRFEITESVLMNNPRFIQEQLKRFKKHGYKIWMDDFGSGYSSLNILKNFDFDLIKIDMEFLRGFDENDDGKIVLKHMVSMLKNLGFHTLTEGVETKEQYAFLKGLGCELLQGYLIGRPMPLEDAVEEIDNAKLCYEMQCDREFNNKVGMVDVLKQNPLEGCETNVVESVLPLAIGVVRDDIWEFVYVNEGYMHAMGENGRSSLTLVEDMINNHDKPWLQRNQFWELCDLAKKSGEPETMEFVENGRIINLRARHITTDVETNADAYMISLRTVTNFLNETYEKKTYAISNSLFSLYECIDVFGLDDGYYENMYLSNSQVHVKDKDKTADEMLEAIANERLHEEDRSLFLEFMNLKTVRDRVATENNGIKLGIFRIRNARGEFVWKIVTIRVIQLFDREVLLSCVSEASIEMVEHMDNYIRDTGVEERKAAAFSPGAGKDAFENVLRLVPAGVFWKDKERRFMGANQMFLDYYGLKSEDSIIGKTDEDMGWHINPEPFKKDELDVINNGRTIRNVSGECIVKGQVRNIVASKQPFIVNGETIGLIGFFNDVTEEVKVRESLETMSLTDQLTGLLNRRAYEDIIDKYVQQYEEDKTDFMMMIIDIDKFKQVNDYYGHEFGDLVLKEVCAQIKAITSNSSVAFRIGGDEFAMLHQFRRESEIESIRQELEIKVAAIDRIDNQAIKIKISIGVAFYSEGHNKHDLYKLADKRMYEDKQSHKN